MKNIDYRPIVVKVKKGNQDNEFLQHLHKKNVKIRNISYFPSGMEFEIARKDLSKLKEVRKKCKVKITIQYRANEKLLPKNSWGLLGLFLFIIIPIICSQFVWKVEVNAETPELQKDVEQVLYNQLKLNKPVLKNKMMEDFDIRQKIMEQIRDLSWVHILKTGSKVTIIPQKAPINHIKKSSRNERNHLIASKSGVITHFNITKGERSVTVNSTVHKGDILVSGIIQRDEKEILIGAEGEVFADYWLETDFTIPKKVKYIQTNGIHWMISFNHNKKEEEPYFQKIDLPKWLEKFIVLKKIQNYTLITEELSEKEVKSLILPLLHEKILTSLPPKSAIKNENILHVTFDDDKVKGKVLFLINENIAVPAPIEHNLESAE